MSRYPLPPCRWRHPVIWGGRSGCSSPIVNAGPFGVMDHTCMMCPDADHLDQSAPALPEPRAGDIRHLLFHLYPVGEWRDHCTVLRRYAPLFNGRRIVGVALGPETAQLDEVRLELQELRPEILAFTNDPSLKEMVSYPVLVELLKEHHSRQDVTFYAHGKGVVSAEHVGPAARRWTTAMYEALLGHWAEIRRQLKDHSTVGLFRRLWQGPIRTRSQWHFSGCFRWTRNADFYARDWRTMDRTWLGSETHPGLLFGRGESSCLYGEFDTQDIGLYADSEWDRWAEPQRRAWLEAHFADRQEPELVSVLLMNHSQPVRVREAIASVLAQTTPDWQLVVRQTTKLAGLDFTKAPLNDPRILGVLDAESLPSWDGPRGQGPAYNREYRDGFLRGTLLVHLSDDDVLDPDWLRRVIACARLYPERSAWYGEARRERVRKDGTTQRLPGLKLQGQGKPGNLLRCKVDGMQIAHRRSVITEWPEKPELAAHADGWWMDALSAKAVIYPVDALVGTHRHTPESTFTQ